MHRAYAEIGVGAAKAAPPPIWLCEGCIWFYYFYLIVLSVAQWHRSKCFLIIFLFIIEHFQRWHLCFDLI